VDQVVDRPETETCAKWTLGGVLRSGVLRTGVLIAGAALASVLTVDLPLPASRATGGQDAAQPYVPASDKWIELGVPQRSAAPPRADRLQADLLQGAAAVDPAAEPAHRTQRRQSAGKRARSMLSRAADPRTSPSPRKRGAGSWV
jgi:hypothetical protein